MAFGRSASTDFYLLAFGLVVLAAVPAFGQGEGVAQKEVYCKLVSNP
jgi:hypothetical protein